MVVATLGDVVPGGHDGSGSGGVTGAGKGAAFVAGVVSAYAQRGRQKLVTLTAVSAARATHGAMGRLHIAQRAGVRRV
jgi:hypothetical protein